MTNIEEDNVGKKTNSRYSKEDLPVENIARIENSVFVHLNRVLTEHFLLAPIRYYLL